MPLAKPSPGTLADPAHPLARGLVGAWLMNEGAGNSVRSAVGPLHGTRIGNSGSNLPAWTTGVYGRALTFDGTTADQGVTVADPSGRLAGLPALTLAVLINATGPGGSGFGRIAMQDGQNGYSFLGVGAGGGAQFTVGGAAYNLGLSNTLIGTGWRSLVGTYDGYSTVRVYLDGQQILSAGRTAAIPANTAGLLIGNNPGSARTFAGQIGGVWVSSSAWSDKQVKQFAADPFAMFRRPSVAIYAPLGPTNYDLTASPISAGTPTVGTPTLTQNHALTATALASGTPTVETPAITQSHTLTAVALATGTPTVGTPALTQNHTLAAVSIVSGAPTLGSPAITTSTAPLPGNNQLNPLPGARDEWRFWHHREPITLRSLTGAGVYTSHAVTDAKPRAITIREAAASGGVYTTQDRTWLIPTVLIPDNVAPKPGDVIRQANNTDWTVLAVDPLGKFGNTYRLTTRNLVVFAALTQTARVLRPTQATNTIGQRSPTFTEVYANLVVRIQEQTHTIPELQGGATDRRDYVMYVGTRLTLRAGDIVESGGLRYDVTGAGNWDRLDQLGEVRLSKAGVM